VKTVVTTKLSEVSPATASADSHLDLIRRYHERRILVARVSDATKSNTGC